MKIIHCAPFNLFTKTGGALYSNPVKISMGLIENGHFVHNFDYRDTARYHSIFKNKKNGAKKMNQFFLNLIDEIKPDLIIFGHAELITEETLHIIKKKNIKMIFWFNDMIIDDLFSNVGDIFDAAFITGAGGIIEEMSQYNKKTFFLPNPVNKNIEKYHAYNNSQSYDLLFSGRKDIERKAFVQFMERNFEHLKTKFIGQSKDTTIIGDKYFKLICNSKICLNHTRDFGLEYKWYVSDRLAHILGNGAFCLSRPIISGEEFFEDKLAYYTNNDDLQEKVKYYLDNDELRISNAKWLRERTHKLFNTKRVSQYILDIINEDTKSLKQYEWGQ